MHTKQGSVRLQSTFIIMSTKIYFEYRYQTKWELPEKGWKSYIYRIKLINYFALVCLVECLIAWWFSNYIVVKRNRKLSNLKVCLVDLEKIE